MVNRGFTHPAIVSPYAQIWSAQMPNARVVADQETLDLAQNAHDLVVHSLSLHWADDPVGQLIQCRRSLKPDGLLIAATFGGETLNELRSCLAQAEITLTGGLSPRIAPMGEIRDLGALLQRAGLSLPVADSVSLNVEYKDVYHLMHDLRSMGETNALADRNRKIPHRDLFDLTQTLYAQNFPGSDGRLRATFEIVFLTGWAPDESQQKPLRPGSAQQRLADALSVPETPCAIDPSVKPSI